MHDGTSPLSNAPCSGEPTRTCTVDDSRIGTAVFATRDIAIGEEILRIEGTLRDGATRHSIQLDHDTHIEVEPGYDEARIRAWRPWKYLNHCCSPNARLVGRSLVAIERIASGAEITFDYTTTEADMAAPFNCGCGHADCLGLVRGFAHLDQGQREARSDRIAPHLAAFLPLAAPCARA